MYHNILPILIVCIFNLDPNVSRHFFAPHCFVPNVHCSHATILQKQNFILAKMYDDYLKNKVLANYYRVIIARID